MKSVDYFGFILEIPKLRCLSLASLLKWQFLLITYTLTNNLSILKNFEAKCFLFFNIVINKNQRVCEHQLLL